MPAKKGSVKKPRLTAKSPKAAAPSKVTRVSRKASPLVVTSSVQPAVQVATPVPAESSFASASVVQEMQQSLKELQDTLKAALPFQQPSTTATLSSLQEEEEAGSSLPPGLPTADKTGNPVQSPVQPNAPCPTLYASISSGVTLDIGVGEKLKNEILLGNYISLASLLKDQPLSVVGKLDPGTGQVSFSMGEKVETLDNFDQWMQAFMVFSSVLVKAFPDQAAGLFKYMSSVMQMKQQGGNWKKYDELFRKRKSQLNYHWAYFDVELFALARSNMASQPGENMASQPRANMAGEKRKSSQVCFRFQEGLQCSKDCKFWHACELCLTPGHGRHSCWKSAQRGKPNKKA